MARYFIELAYKGTRYHGWQIQNNGISVQGELEKALHTLLREKVSITGAGRTDSGVHSKYMVAHFDFSSELDDPVSLASKLSSFLPFDITVYHIKKVDDKAHARFDAIGRRYEYHITLGKNPFTRNLATCINYKLDFDAMNRAARVLLENEDFTSFSKLHSSAKTNLCDVTSAFWEQRDDRWVFTIQANRFLRDMVRAIVGTLLDVGRGKLSQLEFSEIIKAKDRGKAGSSVLAKGLYLVDVIYPKELFTRSNPL